MEVALFTSEAPLNPLITLLFFENKLALPEFYSLCTPVTDNFWLSSNGVSALSLFLRKNF